MIYTQMFQWMLDSLRSGYGVVGVSHRSGNNRKTNEVDENTRLFAVWGISVKKYRKVGAKFADNPFKEDFHMQLAFLTNGIKTICNNLGGDESSEVSIMRKEVIVHWKKAYESSQK